MALSTATVTRRINLHNVVIALSLTGATLAILPIVAGVIGGLNAGSAARTAYASAPAGEYAVYVSAGESEDRILVASSEDAGEPMLAGVVPHLPRFPTRGAVSPDGRRVALVVVDAGTAAEPGASLLILHLETGELARAAIDIDHLQQPLWSPDGGAVVVTRGGDAAPGPVSVLTVHADASGESQSMRIADALGVFPVAFDPDGRLVSVVIDDRGSSLVRDGIELQTFTTRLSRDWALSPDGKQLAYIETVMDGGVRYEPRTVAVEPSGVVVAAQSLGGSEQALGVAWPAGGAAPVFGVENQAISLRSNGSVSGQSLADGFDIPLGFAASGESLAVQHWSGPGFHNPGAASIELVAGNVRRELTGATGFLGWAAR